MLNDNKLKRMRDILTNPGVGVGVGAGDPLCAKLIERAGFGYKK